MNSDSIADTLRSVMAETSEARVSVRWLLAALHKRAFGFLLLILALPNIVPMPPGVSMVLGVLLLFPSIQMLFGSAQPWLPQMISDYQIRSRTVRFVVDKSTPWLDRIAPLTHERLVFLTEGASIQVLGAVCVVLALVLMLPIFLGHVFPGLAICLIAIGLIERDGVFILLGMPLVAASLAIMALDLELIRLVAHQIIQFVRLISPA